MADQNDNDFIDDDLDGDLSSDNNDILDVVEESAEDISDYDDTEEGIFAPLEEQKKKGSSSMLLGTVALIALVGAGGFYAYTQTDLLNSLKSSPPVDMAAAPDAPAPVAALSEDPEMAAIPQPQAITNTSESEAAPATADAAAVPAVPVTPDPAANAVIPADAPPDTAALPAIAEPAPSPATAPVDMAAATAPADNVAPSVTAPVEPPAVAPAPAMAPDMPAPPSPEESKTAVAPTPVPDVAAATPAPVPAPVAAPAVTPDAVAPAPEAVAVPVPQQAQLAPAPVTLAPAPAQDQQVASAPAPLAADQGQSASVGVPKSSQARTDTYYDAPGSSALTAIPTPSLDPMRGRNESIILVQSQTKKSSPKKTSKPKVEPVYEDIVADAPEISSSSQEGAIVAAGRALRLGRYDAAYDMYSDLYRANPRDGRILMGRAVSLQKLGRDSEAISAYEDVLNVDADNPDAIVNMMGLVRKQQPAVALEKLLTLKEHSPNNPAILAQLGVAYADAGNLDEASAALGSAIRLDPNNPQHYFNMGVIAERMKSRPRAIAFYEKALEVDAVYGNGRGINRDMIYDRLARLRG